MSSWRTSVFDQGANIDVSGFEPRKVAKPAAQPDQMKARVWSEIALRVYDFAVLLGSD
jgi:hypothetical protein